MVSASSSSRRFDLGSATQPIKQFICATLPFFFLLLWFLYQAHIRPYTACYENNPGDFDDDQSKNELAESCSKLIPLEQFVYVYLGVAFFWTVLSVYVTFYVPRRHKLVEAYLRQGETAIGDVIFDGKKRSIMSLTSHGHLEYPHPSKDQQCTIRRRVFLYERYTRELSAVLYLPGQPTSGQPKIDLQIDHDVTELNRDRLTMLFWYSWTWALFCLLAPLYILKIMDDLGEVTSDENVWQPEHDIADNFVMIYCLSAYVAIPIVSLLMNLLAWFWHKRSMTTAHTIVGEASQDSREQESNAVVRTDSAEKDTEASYEPPELTSTTADTAGTKASIA